MNKSDRRFGLYRGVPSIFPHHLILSFCLYLSDYHPETRYIGSGNEIIMNVDVLNPSAAVEQEFASESEGFSDATTNQANDATIQSVFSEGMESSAEPTNENKPITAVKEEVEAPGTAPVKGVVREKEGRYTGFFLLEDANPLSSPYPLQTIPDMPAT